MKKVLFIFSLGVFLCVCCTSKTDIDNSSNYEKWNDNVIMPYAEAFNEVAKVSPIIGGDTETDWAASQIDSIYQELKSNKMSLLEKSANIHKMQSYMAYGISYFLSVAGSYQEPNAANAVHDICYNTDSLFNELQKAQYKNYEDINFLSWISLCYYNTYFQLYNAVMGEVYNPQRHMASMVNILKEEAILYESLDDKGHAYRLFKIIEQSAFFMTMCPLIQSLQFKEHYYQTQDSINSYAHWFDAHTQPIEIKIRENKIADIQYISDAEFYDFMVEATKRKVDMLKIFKQTIESRKDE